MKRGERIALSLRTVRGIPAAELNQWPNERREFEELGLMREVEGNCVLTRRGKLLADSVQRKRLFDVDFTGRGASPKPSLEGLFAGRKTRRVRKSAGR